MLKIEIMLSPEQYDSVNECFIPPKYIELELEHSLVSVHEWESKWCKSFISDQEKTQDETLDYIKCMTLTKNVDPDVYNFISAENVKQINEYISAPMTATTFAEQKGKGGGGKERITAELIYYWMISLQIPFECKYWHLNQLLTLIKVCNIKNSPPKKMGKKALMSRNAALNAQRRAQMNTKG